MTLPSGTRLGTFEITNLLGVGGMGEVYRARDTKLGRDVAIKVLPEEFAQDPERLARLEREAKLLAALDHPNISALHEFREEDGVHFLVMQLVEGEDLSDRIDRGPIPVKEALPLFVQIAEAIEAAHEQGIIHRDLKPANIKISKDGNIKVLDFGMAKPYKSVKTPSPIDTTKVSASDPTKVTADGSILGTPSYMSPEQARGQKIDKRSDIWAFGCCLYETLTGDVPFQGETTADVIVEILGREPEWQALPKSAPPAVTALLHRCLEKDVRKRLRNMGEIAREINDVSAALQHFRQPSSWRRFVPWTVAAVVAVMGGVLIWSVLRSGSGEGLSMESSSSAPPMQSASSGDVALPAGVPRVAVLPFVNATTEEDIEWLGQGFCETITNELSRSDLLTVVERSQIDKILAELDFEHTQWVDVTTAQEVGRILGVDYVVIGSFQLIDQQVRVNSRQVRVSSGEVVGADTLDGFRSEMFELQERTGQSMRKILERAATDMQP